MIKMYPAAGFRIHQQAIHCKTESAVKVKPGFSGLKDLQDLRF
jgi:hypothetical protein